jgi:hypothetical protein
MIMDAIAEKLDAKLSQWKPEVSAEVRSLISEVIEAADEDALDVMRSRAVEQEVLDSLDDPAPRVHGLAPKALCQPSLGHRPRDTIT